MQRSSIRFVIILAVMLGTAGLATPFILSHFSSYAVSVHQRGVTRELAAWEVEVSQIRNEKDAIHAAQMLRYVQNYYVPGDGYRGDPVTEGRLEEQRQQTLTKIAKSLATFTGQDFGTNAVEWEAWLRKGRLAD